MHIDVMFDMTGDDDLHKELLKKSIKILFLYQVILQKIVTRLAHEKEDLIEN